MYDELADMDELIPMSNLRFVWPNQFSCTNDHFNGSVGNGLKRGDNHTIQVKTFYTDEPIANFEEWTNTYFNDAMCAVSDRPQETYDCYKLKCVNCFLLLEMALHESETLHAHQTKQKDKEDERAEAEKNMMEKKEAARLRSAAKKNRGKSGR